MTDCAALSVRQKQVLDFMYEFYDTWRMWPSVRDIGEKFEIKSPNGVMYHLRALEKKGYVTHQRGLSRSWRPVKRAYDIVCPDCGCVLEVSEEMQ